jgi:RNA polymerase sigma-70 factor (ECF subfamily)
MTLTPDALDRTRRSLHAVAEVVLAGPQHPTLARPGVRVRDVSETLPDDAVVVAGLRRRDETTFTALVDAWSSGMLRAARAFVADDHAAQDVVQETWLGVLRGIDRFRGDSSLRTWAYRILINRAKTRGVRDARTVPAGLTADERGPTVSPHRFRGPDEAYPGHWRSFPAAWPTPEDGALSAETRRHLAVALTGLPPRQRAVVTLRDVDGYTSDEVCDLLTISSTNQRVLLHRGRAALRAALEAYLTEGVRP